MLPSTNYESSIGGLRCVCIPRKILILQTKFVWLLFGSLCLILIAACSRVQHRSGQGSNATQHGNKPDWLHDKKPDWLHDKKPDWLHDNKPDWLHDNKPNWLQLAEKMEATGDIDEGYCTYSISRELLWQEKENLLSIANDDLRSPLDLIVAGDSHASAQFAGPKHTYIAVPAAKMVAYRQREETLFESVVTGVGRQCPAGVRTIDPVPWFCSSSSSCLIAENTTCYFRDKHHMSNSGSLRLEKLFARMLTS